MNITESQGKVRREDHGTRECLKYKNARVSQKIRGRDRIRNPPPTSFTLLLCYPATFFVNELFTSSVSGTLKTKISVSPIHHYSVIRSLFNSQDYEYFPRRLFLTHSVLLFILEPALAKQLLMVSFTFSFNYVIRLSF